MFAKPLPCNSAWSCSYLLLCGCYFWVWLTAGCLMPGDVNAWIHELPITLPSVYNFNLTLHLAESSYPLFGIPVVSLGWGLLPCSSPHLLPGFCPCQTAHICITVLIWLRRIDLVWRNHCLSEAMETTVRRLYHSFPACMPVCFISTPFPSFP